MFAADLARRSSTRVALALSELSTSPAAKSVDASLVIASLRFTPAEGKLHITAGLAAVLGPAEHEFPAGETLEPKKRLEEDAAAMAKKYLNSTQLKEALFCDSWVFVEMA